MTTAAQIDTDGLSERDFRLLATKLEAARAMLAALHQDLNQFDTLHRLGILTASQAIECGQFARAAIAQARAAGIEAPDA